MDSAIWKIGIQQRYRARYANNSYNCRSIKGIEIWEKGSTARGLNKIKNSDNINKVGRDSWTATEDDKKTKSNISGQNGKREIGVTK